jgi:hypothetical protein
MAAINLELEKVYYVKVLKTERLERRRTFTLKNKTYYNYVIHLEIKSTKLGEEDKSGWVEYFTEAPELDPKIFPLNVLQYVRCIKCEDLHCCIVPHDPEEELSKEEMARKLVCNDKEEVWPPVAPEIRRSTVTVSGNSFMMCLAYAKDLKIGEMAAQKNIANPKITYYDINDILEWAGKLNEAVVNKLRE